MRPIPFVHEYVRAQLELRPGIPAPRIAWDSFHIHHVLRHVWHALCEASAAP